LLHVRADLRDDRLGRPLANPRDGHEPLHRPRLDGTTVLATVVLNASGVASLMALFAFVTWTVLRANEGEDKAMPAARESSASDKTAFR
jgi:hypothetical protein